MTGFDLQSFKIVCALFSDLYYGYFPFAKDCEEDTTIMPKVSPRGRKRKIRAEDCLGLVLAWTRTRGSLAILQMIFGMTLTNLSVYIRFGHGIIIELFKNHPMSAI